ncbi:MAG: Serine phosphatase RsbU subunit sigma [Deltaproteobacteria bacterium]|nr:Serine phosphatase RsbU subunit sigma [Deltaproteobacteria bacterium]
MFWALVGLMAATSVAAFVSALSFVNRPFPGFLVYNFPNLGSMSIRDWTGKQAGLKFPARIVEADGQPISGGQEVIDLVRAKQPGAPVHYLIKTDQGLEELEIPVDMFTYRDFFWTFFVNFACGFILILLGCIVYWLKPNTASSWAFLALCLSLGGYMVTSFDCQSTYRLILIQSLATPIFPATFFHLGLIFPDRKRFVARWPWSQYAIYFPALVLAFGFLALARGITSAIVNYELVGASIRIFTLFSVACLVGFVFHAVRSATTGVARQRARMILFGIGVAFVPSLIITLLVFFMKVYFPWNFLIVFLIFFPASIGYSIVRHNLFDADVIIKRTVGYAVVTAVVVGVYAIVSVILNVYMEQSELRQSRAFPILFTLGVIVVFNPLRNRIQRLVDRVFFRKEYDSGKIIDSVSGAIASLMDLGQVLKYLTETFVRDMFINTTSVLLLAPAGAGYQVYLAEGEGKSNVEGKSISQDDPIIRIIEKEKKELTKYDVLEDPKYREVSERCTKEFDELRASVIVPIVFKEKLIGLLSLGEKKSGKSFNRQDVDLVRTVANQGAIAIENARLFEENLEKQRMEEELSIARDLQMSMLPAECPSLAGFGIAAVSIPAREVGGDFYDFIEMGKDKIGFVIGDVTGKSVSGALVMSAARSVFRMLSEEQIGVGEIMIRANRRTKKDIKSGMFVALLYVILDGGSRTVSLCSAGQTQPIHVSAKTGKAELVQTQGDNFPLGILDGADYQETTLQLEPEDKLIFYTDGIVEAMNEQKGIFGFDRLLQVAEAGRGLKAEELLKKILDEVKKFCGDAAQHDDLTVIVVGVIE